jgi:DNA ligase-1
MALLSDLTALRARVAASPGRLEKRRLVADYLRGLSPDDLPCAVTYLSGRAFPASDPRVLNVRGLPAPSPSPCPLRRGEAHAGRLAQAFGAVADAAGPGARRLRDARLGQLTARASAEERDLLQRVIYGEMRMGFSEGLVLEAIAEAAGAAPAVVRRAALVTGDLTAVASLALGHGEEALAAAAPRVFVPSCPCWLSRRTRRGRPCRRPPSVQVRRRAHPAPSGRRPGADLDAAALRGDGEPAGRGRDRAA